MPGSCRRGAARRGRMPAPHTPAGKSRHRPENRTATMPGAGPSPTRHQGLDLGIHIRESRVNKIAVSPAEIIGIRFIEGQCVNSAARATGARYVNAAHARRRVQRGSSALSLLSAPAGEECESNRHRDQHQDEDNQGWVINAHSNHAICLDLDICAHAVNVPDQRPGGSGSRNATEPQSAGSLHLACWPAY